MPALIAARATGVDLGAVDADRPGLRVIETENRLEQLGPSGPDQPEEADDSPGAHGERDVRETGPAGERRTASTGFGRRLRMAPPTRGGSSRPTIARTM